MGLVLLRCHRAYGEVFVVVFLVKGAAETALS